MNRRGLLLLALALCVSTIKAQRLAPEAPSPLGVYLHLTKSTRGSGAGIELITGPGAGRNIFGLQAFSVRDAREARIRSPYRSDQGTRYIYGKLNRLYVITPYAGIMRELIPARKDNNLAVTATLQGGPALGLLRAYYVDIFKPRPNQPFIGEAVAERYNPDEHTYQDIVGVSGFFATPWDLSLRLGLSARAALRISYSQKEESNSAIELGIQADYFPSAPPIMAFVENRKLFVAATVGLIVGGKN